MRPSYPQRTPFSSGQPPQHSFVRATIAGTGIASMRQQSRFSQPNDNHNNPNNMHQQQSTHVPNSGLQTGTRQQPSNTLYVKS
jgi:hypothetical protein